MGWIAIDRRIKDHWIWAEPERFQWWIDLLLSANFEDKNVVIGNNVIVCRRGECVQSLLSWAKHWKTSKDVVRSFFRKLESDGMIKHENLGFTTRISIVNYEFYQNLGRKFDENLSQVSENQIRHGSGHGSDTDLTRINDGKSASYAKAGHGSDTDLTRRATQHNNNNNKNNTTNCFFRQKNKFSDANTEEENPVKDIVIIEDIPPERKQPPTSAAAVLESYKQLCPSLTPIAYMTKKRSSRIQELINRRNIDIIKIRRAFEILERSSKYNGNNETGWKAGFDWIFAEDGRIDQILKESPEE